MRTQNSRCFQKFKIEHLYILRRALKQELNSQTHKYTNSFNKKMSTHLRYGYLSAEAASDKPSQVFPGESPRIGTEQQYLLTNWDHTALVSQIILSLHPATLNPHFPPVLPPQRGCLMLQLLSRLAMRDGCNLISQFVKHDIFTAA